MSVPQTPNSKIRVISDNPGADDSLNYYVLLWLFFLQLQTRVLLGVKSLIFR